MQDDFLDVPIPPIGVAIAGPGKYNRIETVTGLAGVLIGSGWPKEKKGDVWTAAVAACLRALEAQINGEAAREAFILAARHADLPLITNADVLRWPEKREKKKLPRWEQRPRAH